MPTVIVPVDSFDTIIPAPDDGEAVDRASLVQFAQPILNRTEATKEELNTSFGMRQANVLETFGPDPIVLAPGVSIVSGTLSDSLTGDLVTLTTNVMIEYVSGPTAFDRITLRAEINGGPMGVTPVFWVNDSLGSQQLATWSFSATAPVDATSFELFVERQGSAGVIAVQVTSTRVQAERLYSL